MLRRDYNPLDHSIGAGNCPQENRSKACHHPTTLAFGSESPGLFLHRMTADPTITKYGWNTFCRSSTQISDFHPHPSFQFLSLFRYSIIFIDFHDFFEILINFSSDSIESSVRTKDNFRDTVKNMQLHDQPYLLAHEALKQMIDPPDQRKSP